MTRKHRDEYGWEAAIDWGPVRLETEKESMTVHVMADHLEDSEYGAGWKKANMDMGGVDLQDLAEFISSLVAFFNARIHDLNETIEDIPQLETAERLNA
jgi:hypothetical protein